MTRFCSSCGKELKETSVNFCEYCGARISSAPPSSDASHTVSEEKTVPKPSATPTKRRMSTGLIIGGLIIIIIIIVAALAYSGTFSDLPVPSSVTPTFTSQPSDENAEVKVNSDESTLKKEAEKYLDLPLLPEDIKLMGQVLGPIPGKKVEFVFEGGPGIGVCKSWKAVLISPDGNLLGTEEGQVVKNDLITLKGENIGTHTGIIVATSYSGETYKVTEQKVLFRG